MSTSPSATPPAATSATITATTLRERQLAFVYDVFEKTTSPVPKDKFDGIPAEELATLYNFCRVGIPEGQTVDEAAYKKIAERVDSILSVAKVITEVRDGNPYLTPFQDFLDAVDKIGQEDDHVVRVGASLEAIGALMEGIGKLVKKTGQFLQEHPKVLGALATVVGIAVPLLFPATTSIVAGIAIAVAFIEVGAYSYRKYKEKQIKRQLQAQGALSAIAEGSPALSTATAAAVEEQRARDAMPVAVEVTDVVSAAAGISSELTTKATQIAARVGSVQKDVILALGKGGIEKLKLGDIGSKDARWRTHNRDALKVIIEEINKAPTKVTEATARAEEIVGKVKREVNSGSRDLSPSQAVLVTALGGEDGLQKKLATALAPVEGTNPLDKLQQIANANKVVAEFLDSLETPDLDRDAKQTKEVIAKILKEQVQNKAQAILKGDKILKQLEVSSALKEDLAIKQRSSGRGR